MTKNDNIAYISFLKKLYDKYGVYVVNSIPNDLILEAYLHNNLEAIERFIDRGYISLGEVRREGSCNYLELEYSFTKHGNSASEDVKLLVSSEFADSDFEDIMLSLIDRADSLEEIDKSTITYEKIANSDGYKPVKVTDEVKEKSRKYVNEQCIHNIMNIISKYIHFEDSNL